MTSKELTRNASFVLAAKIVNAAFSFVVFLLIAGSLEIATLGLYTLVLSIASVVTVISDWGATQHLFRRGSAAPAKIARMLTASSMSRAFFGLTLGAVVTLVLIFWRGGLVLAVAQPLALVVALLHAQTVVYIVSLRARGNMSLEVWLYAGRGALKLACVALVCKFHPTLPAVLASLIIVNTTGNLFVYRYNRKHYTQRAPRTTCRYARAFIKRSTPYFWMGAYSILLTQMGVLILGVMSNDAQIGIFGVALQFFQTLLLLPVAFTIALQPILVQVFETDRNRWAQQVRRLVLLSIIPAFVVSGILTVFLPLMIPYLFGDRYLSSMEVLRILMIAFCFRSLWMSTLLPSFISGDKVKQWNQVLLCSLVMQMLFSAVAVRVYGAIGAAYGVLISDGAIALLGGARMYFITARARVSS